MGCFPVTQPSIVIALLWCFHFQHLKVRKSITQGKVFANNLQTTAQFSLLPLMLRKGCKT